MSWRPIDFRGMIDLDPKIIEELEYYLQEKENRLAHQIMHTFTISGAESAPPVLPSGSSLKLSDAVESFTKQVRALPKSDGGDLKAQEECYRVEKGMNRAFWEYTEILEGCVVELFQQVRQVPLDRWHISLSVVVQALKDMLYLRIEDLMWTIRRLEKPLNEFCQKRLAKPNRWLDWLPFKKSRIDAHLLQNLQQTETFLKTQFAGFKERYNEYLMLNIQAEESLEKMKSYAILALLDIPDQNVYVDVFRLLKMIELNPHPKREVAIETSRALKHLTSVDHVQKVFRLYLREIQEAFFTCSLEWKSLSHEEEQYPEAVKKLRAKVADLQQELRQFMLTMSRYRTFILKTDDNPYVRSRWGFTEWVVGPEPAKAKQLISLLYSAEELDANFIQFAGSLERDPLSQQNIEYHAHEEIEHLLHEMGQPLISRSMMVSRAERFLDALKACDEVGSPQISTIFYVEDKLSKAMRADWKYHVLHEFPLFHQIYRLHKGLEEVFDDPPHAFRLDRFQSLFSQMLEWVNKGDVYAHVHEIEIDMNDMKTYLQDFLASIQRAGKEKSSDPFFDETIVKFCQELLEYRYLFGQFFLSLMNKSPDSQQLRHQFLFVDQYFETIENLLIDLKANV